MSFIVFPPDPASLPSWRSGTPGRRKPLAKMGHLSISTVAGRKQSCHAFHARIQKRSKVRERTAYAAAQHERSPPTTVKGRPTATITATALLSQLETSA